MGRVRASRTHASSFLLDVWASFGFVVASRRRRFFSTQKVYRKVIFHVIISSKLSPQHFFRPLCVPGGVANRSPPRAPRRQSPSKTTPGIHPWRQCLFLSPSLKHHHNHHQTFHSCVFCKRSLSSVSRFPLSCFFFVFFGFCFWSCVVRRAPCAMCRVINLSLLHTHTHSFLTRHRILRFPAW